MVQRRVFGGIIRRFTMRGRRTSYGVIRGFWGTIIRGGGYMGGEDLCVSGWGGCGSCDLRFDVFHHSVGIFASKHVFVAIVKPNHKTVRRLTIVGHISADITLSEYAPITHETAGTKEALAAHCRLKPLDAHNAAHWNRVDFERTVNIYFIHISRNRHWAVYHTG